jgi:cyclic beta-1,2-glucan synthetase
MEPLERYRGHFYNWYDTRTLAPMPPHYVSSVDSGNLAGALLTLRAGLLELKDQPVLFPPSALDGLRDTLGMILSEEIEPPCGRCSSPPPSPDLTSTLEWLRKFCLEAGTCRPRATR